MPVSKAIEGVGVRRGTPLLHSNDLAPERLGSVTKGDVGALCGGGGASQADEAVLVREGVCLELEQVGGLPRR